MAKRTEFNPELAREGLKKWLVKWTNCNIQHGYPCGTCTMALLNSIGLDKNKPEYREHNKGKDRTRHNEVWRAILQIRDAELLVKKEE